MPLLGNSPRAQRCYKCSSPGRDYEPQATATNAATKIKTAKTDGVIAFLMFPPPLLNRKPLAKLYPLPDFVTWTGRRNESRMRAHLHIPTDARQVKIVQEIREFLLGRSCEIIPVYVVFTEVTDSVKPIIRLCRPIGSGTNPDPAPPERKSMLANDVGIRDIEPILIVHMEVLDSTNRLETISVDFRPLTRAVMNGDSGRALIR